MLDFSHAAGPASAESRVVQHQASDLYLNRDIAGGCAASGSVAVITRTRNRNLLLPRAIRSVLDQTHQTWRHYIVNDGGDRAALDTLLAPHRERYAGRLTVIHHAQSLGMENASNAALLRGGENFVAVHDDDDAWHPDFLRRATEFLTGASGAGFAGVTGGCVVVQERLTENGIEEIGRSPWRNGRGCIAFAAMLQANQFPPIALVFRRAAIAAIGPFNGAMPVLGDWEFNIRLMLLGDIGFIDEPMAFYHQRPRGSGPVYGNTVVDGIDEHAVQHVRFRNGLLRAALAAHPELLGLLQPLLERFSAIDKKLDRLLAINGDRRRARTGSGGAWSERRQRGVSAKVGR